MSNLKLGPIADDKPLQLTIELPGALHRYLIAYAVLHAKATRLAEPLLPEKPTGGADNFDLYQCDWRSETITQSEVFLLRDL